MKDFHNRPHIKEATMLNYKGMLSGSVGFQPRWSVCGSSETPLTIFLMAAFECSAAVAISSRDSVKDKGLDIHKVSFFPFCLLSWPVNLA